jgi:adenylylsulfate kinase-like enzyme
MIKNKGILFWITGFSGSGKTQISKKIHSQIIKNYGPTILFSGDDIRRIFNLKSYAYKDRFETVMKYCKLAKFSTSQNINVIFAVIGMMDEIRKWNRKNIKNYVEIYIKSDLTKIINKRKKKIYHQDKKNIVGLDIKPEYPKKPDIILHNNFKKNIDTHAKELLIKLKKLKKLQNK